MIEIEVYPNSNFEDLALQAVRRIGLKETQKNIDSLHRKLKTKFISYVKELKWAVQTFENQSIHWFTQKLMGELT